MNNANASNTVFGLGTFGDVTTTLDGAPVAPAQVIRNLVEEARLADQVGVDAWVLGEHHRDDFAVSSPEIVLAAAATVTDRILLATGVTVLSSDDPVRVFERFSTLDAVSNGRAEVQLGRGSFTESFPLFGYELSDYEVLFEEKLDLFVRLLEEQPVTWSGSTRAGLTNQRVYPPTEHGLKAWVGVGGSPESVVRAARVGLPMVVAIIGGEPVRFAPFVQLYRRALAELGRPDLPVAVHSPGHVAATDEEAFARFIPHQRAMRARIGAERGWPAPTEAEFRHEVERGSLYVGSADTVAAKIATTVRELGIQRFDLKYSGGTLPHEHALDSIERFGRDVIPKVRELLGETPITDQ